ncbi:lactonase family protein [Kitasatospora sp. NPDC006697]|uniref:lactonase family protein n=1 Tax=Kitasatospora sp. NPDC006697 TaxID=3364020 RepID=UPI0036A656D7
MSNRIARAAALAGAALTAVALCTVPASATAAHRVWDPVFVQTDALDGNTVVAYDRALHQLGSYPTGGNGGRLAGSAVDHLASQGSLAYDRAHGLLYAVNAGSDTITVFAVHGDRLERRQVLPSGGAFPVGLAVHGDLVYVLNALDGGSVQGFRLDDRRLHPLPQSHRGLGLDPAATPQFTHTPGQVAFTPDGSGLVVTTKAGGNSIDVFPLDHHGMPAAQPVVNTEPGTVPFGFTFDPQGRLVVTEVGPEAVAVYTLDHAGRATLVTQSPTGQAATCWIAAAGGHYYVSNAGSATVSTFGADPLTPLATTPTDPGTVDAATTPDAHWLYVQTGATGTVDAFRIAPDGMLTRTGSVTVPDATGGEGIVAL